MLSTHTLLQPTCPEEPILVSQLNCIAAQVPANLYRSYLEYTFHDSYYLVNQFADAITNKTIRNAFNRAIYNPNYALGAKFANLSPGEIYTETSHTQSVTTVEGKTAIVIKWVEHENEIQACNFEKAHYKFSQPFTRETVLFLSDQEIIFIPGTIDFTNIDQLQYHAGMRFLYSKGGPREYVEADVVREISIHPEIIKKLSKFHERQVSYGKVELSYSPGEIQILIKDQNIHKKHIFSKYYEQGFAAIFGLFKPTVSYKEIDMQAKKPKIKF